MGIYGDMIGALLLTGACPIILDRYLSGQALALIFASSFTFFVVMLA